MKKLLYYLWKFYSELFTYWTDSVARQVAQRRFKKARLQAQTLANSQRRKYWVIRGKHNTYTVLNASDIRHYKNIGVFKKSVNFLHLDKIASYIATPEKL